MPDLFTQHEALARSIGRRLCKSGAILQIGEITDAEQAACLALLEVIAYHDGHPGLVKDFPAFAAAAIKHELMREAGDSSLIKGMWQHQFREGELERLPSKEFDQDGAPEKDRERIRDALLLLSGRDREILEMRHGIGRPRLSLKQIAEALDVCKRTVRRRVGRATEALKEVLGG